MAGTISTVPLAVHSRSSQIQAAFAVRKNRLSFRQNHGLSLWTERERGKHFTSLRHDETTVHLDDGQGKAVEYTIVGATEAQPTKGLISNESPVGRALLGKRVGDEVQISVPKGVVKYTVTGIS